MAGVEIYFYANCSSCRNAIGLLESSGVTFDRRDIFKERLSIAEIEALFARAHLEPNQVLSTRSRPYNELRLADKELSDDEIVELMSRHPALIKRPLTVKGETAVIGFNRSALAALVAESK